MSDLRAIVPKTDRPILADSPRIASGDAKQRKLMLGSLCLLLLALGMVLWHNRDFWFPDTPDSESDQIVERTPPSQAVQTRTSAAATNTTMTASARPKHKIAVAAKAPIVKVSAPAAVTTTRTVLPPLEVEVVGGDTHRTVRPGSSSVRVTLQPETPPQTFADATVAGETATAANVTSNATERVQMSANTSDVVARPVRPNYPLLARQMKVQGSVILQALIGKDGVIQNLRVVSGPHILASAAEDAVRQWHFKPHIEGNESVETQAKITVNFTISTN
jgi:TonB family protein